MSWPRHAGALIGAVAGTPALAALVAARPRWREGMIERLGGAAAGGAPDSVDAIWVHGASVGEILAGLRLVDRLLARGLPVQTSTSTATARAMVRRMRPELPCRLSPLDHPWCVARALDRARPRALVLVETELWPCWIAAAARRSIPVIVVSGRLSDRSYPHYRRLARVFHGTVDRITGVGARTPLDAERFVELGVPASRVHVTGDLKLDGAKPPPLDPALVRVLEGPPLLVAGSTHPGEEEAALHALAAAERAGLAAALVLAPRHRERFDAVGELVRRSGRKLRRRSWLAAAGEPRLEAGEVLLLDSHGELGSVYAFARLAFVGGTLVARGGHNLLEPAEVGRPAAFGPSTQAVRAAAELLLGVGAAARVGDGAALGRAFVAALHDPGAADAQGDAGQRVLAAHRGSAERSAALVAELCAKAGP